MIISRSSLSRVNPPLVETFLNLTCKLHYESSKYEMQRTVQVITSASQVSFTPYYEIRMSKIIIESKIRIEHETTTMYHLHTFECTSGPQWMEDASISPKGLKFCLPTSPDDTTLPGGYLSSKVDDVALHPGRGGDNINTSTRPLWRADTWPSFPLCWTKKTHASFGILLLYQFALPDTAIAKFVKNLKCWRNFGEIYEDCQLTWFSSTWISRWRGTNSDVEKTTLFQVVLFYQIFEHMSTHPKVVGKEFRFYQQKFRITKLWGNSNVQLLRKRQSFNRGVADLLFFVTTLLELVVEC